MISATYRYECRCDNPLCHAVEVFLSQTKAGALAAVRAAGWTVNEKQWRCHCPKHGRIG